MHQAPKMIGRSRAALELEDEIALTARSTAKVLIEGESGVGKELVARLIHAKSRAAHMPLITVNCAGIPETLLESELFGHQRGSFTGAYRDKPGLLLSADGGMIFLDEIGEMTPRMQGMLLRFLETGELQTVGAAAPRRVNVRVVCATNRDLHTEVEKGTFRADLYYRLNVVRLTVAPLRERSEDIVELLEHFLTVYSQHYQRDLLCLSPDVGKRLVAYPWPGNIRELKNLAERLVVRVRGNRVEMRDLPPQISSTSPVANAPARKPTPSREEIALGQMLVKGRSFWEAVHEPFSKHDLTRDDLRLIIRRGLETAGGDYRALVERFNMPPRDYRRFLNFLRKHDCQPAPTPEAPASDADVDAEDAASPSDLAANGARQRAS